MQRAASPERGSEVRRAQEQGQEQDRRRFKDAEPPQGSDDHHNLGGRQQAGGKESLVGSLQAVPGQQTGGNKKDSGDAPGH